MASTSFQLWTGVRGSVALWPLLVMSSIQIIFNQRVIPEEGRYHSLNADCRF